MRSSVVPQTIASETAQKTNWKNHFDSTVASEKPMIGKAFAGSPKSFRKNPSCPMNFPAPKAKAKPTAQYMIAAIEKFVRIFATTVPEFLPREKPISSRAKPACMNITKQPATITQIELMPTESGRAPLPAASKVSASAPAGSSSEATSPRPSARGTVRRVIDPPGRDCHPQSADPPVGGHSPGVERSPATFLHVVEGAHREGEPNAPMFRQVDNDVPPRRL